MDDTCLTKTDAWRALGAHFDELQNKSLVHMFAADPGRAQALTFEAAGVYLDLSKNRLDADTLALLVNLARSTGFEQARAAMFAGAQINSTEGRPVLHVALRASRERHIEIKGRNVIDDVFEERAKMEALVDDVRDGRWLGYDGQRMTDVVNIGIGGSDLGPRMVTAALEPYQDPALRVHFVANLDGADLAPLLATLNPASTLFLIASKSFTTIETMTNANTARAWLCAAAGDEAAVARHFVALSANPEATAKFGIDDKNRLTFWDWVGGRFSLWSVIGLPIALAIGNARFDELLVGARAMDDHFETSELGNNLPLLLALTGILYRNFYHKGSHAILPYDQRLQALPAYLQQAEMESNGKSVQRDGEPVATATAPVIWGDVGTNAQHAFFQLLHQGTSWVSTDFIAVLQPHHHLAHHHAGLLTNCFAQTAALMLGDPSPDDPHRRFEGNRPSTTIVLERLTPKALGALIALYEHKIFCQGHIWGVNSFDQFGVQLGKTLAQDLAPVVAGADDQALDGSTRALVRRARAAGVGAAQP